MFLTSPYIDQALTLKIRESGAGWCGLLWMGFNHGFAFPRGSSLDIGIDWLQFV